jgi:polyisoprenoid-binding protein YceI
MKTLRIPGAAWLILFLMAATGSPAASSPAAAAPAANAPVRYRYIIDKRKSRVSFTFRGVLVPYDAHFGVLEGEIFLSSGDPFRAASGEIRIRATSVQAQKPEQQRMLYQEVLEARRFPEIRLRVSSVRTQGEATHRRRSREKSWELRAKGVLEMHGAEKELPLSFKLSDTGTKLYLRGRGVLRLSDFGMSRPKVLLLVPGGDDVEVRVRLVAAPAPKK